MMDVIQVVKTVRSFTKEEYRAPKTGLFTVYEPPFFIPGHLDDHHQLQLLNQQSGLPPIPTNGIILLQYISGFEPLKLSAPGQKRPLLRWQNDHYHNLTLHADQNPICFYRQAATLRFEIFKIVKEEPGIFSLYLNYTGNELSIGIPKRSDHKIATLTPQQALRYNINGKSDFTLAGRKARTFIKHDYLIEYKGLADKITFTDSILHSNILSNPTTVKLVDERKMLQ